MSGSPAFKSFTVTPSSFPGSVICNWTFDASYVDTSNIFFITIYANDSNVTDSIVDNRKFAIRNIINEQGSITNTYEVDNLSTDYPYFFTVEVRVSKVYVPTFRNTFAVYTSNSVNYQLPSSPIVPTFKLGQDLDNGFYIKLTDPSNQNINPTVGSSYDGNSALKGLFVSCNNSELGLFSLFFAHDASTNLYTDKLRVPVDVSYGVYDVALTTMNDFKMFSDQSEFKTVIVDHTPGEPTSLIVKKYYPSYEEYFDTPSIEVKIMAPEYKGRPEINYFKVYRTDYNTSLLSSDPSNNNYIFLGDVSASYDVNDNLDSSFSYVDSLDLIPGSYYKYKVFSHSECEQNDGLSLVPTLSNPIVASIYPDQATGLNMWTTSATTLDASWNHSENFSGIEDNYLVYKLILTDASDSDVSPENVTTLNVTTNNTNYSFSGLVAGRKYILRVYAGVFDEDEFLQNFFNEVQPAPLYFGSPYDVQGLTTHVPSDLRIKPNVNHMTYYWDAPASDPSGLTLSGYNVSLYKMVWTNVSGQGYQWVDEETPVQTASIVNENEYTFYGLTQQTKYNFKVSAKYYIGNDATNIVYSNISNINSQTLYEVVNVNLNTPIPTVNEKNVTLTWATTNYDNIYDASFNIYRRIKDLSDNIVETFTLLKTVFLTEVTNGSLRTYVDVSNQTTDFTFGNKIEYYIEAIYYDRENNYLHPTLTSNTDYGILYISPLPVYDVRIKTTPVWVPTVGYSNGATIKWTNPVIPADSGLTYQYSRLFIKKNGIVFFDSLSTISIINQTELTTPELIHKNDYLSAEIVRYYVAGQIGNIFASESAYFHTRAEPITPVLTANNVPGLKKGVLNWTLATNYNNYNVVSEVYREILDSSGTVVEAEKLLKTLTNENSLIDNSTDEGQSEHFIFGSTIKYYVKVTYTDLSNNWTDGVVYTYDPLSSSNQSIVLFNITPLPTELKVKPLDKHLTLEWTAPDMTDSGMELLNYYLYLNDTQLVTISDLTNLSYTYNDLSNNVIYTLAVRANYKPLGGTTLIPSTPQTIEGIPHADPSVPVLSASSLQTEKNIELNWTIDNNYAHYSTTSKIYRQIKNASDVVLDANELIKTLENVSTFNDTHDAVNQSVHFIYGNKITYYVEVIYTDLSNSYVNSVYVYDAVTSTSKYVIMYDNTTTPQNLTVLPSDGQLTLSWTEPDNSENGLTVTSYNLYLDASYVANVDKLYTTYSYYVTNGQSHTFSVEAVNSAGTVTGITSSKASITGIAHAAPAVPVLTANEVQGETKVELSWTLDTSYPYYTTESKVYRQILNASGSALDASSVLIKTLNNVNTHDDVNAENLSTYFEYGNTITYYVVTTYTDLSNNNANGVYTYADLTSASKSVVIYDNPSEPTDLNVVPSDGHLTLSWNAPNNSTNGLTVTGYNVYLDLSFAALLPSSTTSFEYTVTNGQTYELKVESVNSAISSLEGVTVTGITSSKASISGIAHADPAVPVLTANEVQGETKVELSWTLDTSYPYYTTESRIYRQILNASGSALDASGILIKTLNNVNTYDDIDNGENPSAYFVYGNTMTYYVEITYTDNFNNNADGVYVYPVKTSASKSSVIYDNPSKPTALTVVPSNGHLTLSWTPPNNSTNGLTVTGYNVYLDSSSVALVSSSTTSFEYTVTNGQIYELSVESVNSAISSVEGETVTDITSDPETISGIAHADPPVPVLTANEVQGSKKVVLSWTIDTSYSYYTTESKIYRQILDAAGVTLEASTLIKTLNNSNSYDDDDTGENQSAANFAYGNTMTYYVEITYTDNFNNNADGVYVYPVKTSDSKSVVIYDNPFSPTSLTVVPSDGHLTLSWNPPNNSTNGLTLTGYNVYLDSSSVALLPSSTTTFEYAVTNGQQYTLSVDSVNSAISSVADVTEIGITSGSVSITGIAHEDPAVPVLTANEVQGETKVQLSWTIDASYPHYTTVSKIYRQILDADGLTLEASTLIKTLDNSNSYDDIDNGENQSSNFAYGNTMTYYVVITYTDNFNNHVDGIYVYSDVTSASKSSVIYDNASIPTGLAVVPSDGIVTLSWTAPDNEGKGLTLTGYNVYVDSSFVAFVDHSITSHSYNLTNGQTYVLGVQSVNSAVSSVVGETVTELLSAVEETNGKPYKLATSTLIANATNANNGVQAGKTVLLTFTIDNSESNCNTVEIYRKITGPSGNTLEDFTLIDTITSSLVNGENTYVDRDSVQNSDNFLNGNTMRYYVKLNYSEAINYYSYDVTSSQDFTVPYDRPTPSNYDGLPVTNKACIIPLDLDNGEFSEFNLVVSKNGSDLTTVVAVGLTNGGNGTVLQYSSSSSTVIGNVVVNNQNNAQIPGVCAANQVKVIRCSFPSPVTEVTDVFAFINNQAGSLLMSYPVDGIFLP